MGVIFLRDLTTASNVLLTPTLSFWSTAGVLGGSVVGRRQLAGQPPVMESFHSSGWMRGAVGSAFTSPEARAFTKERVIETWAG